MLSLNLEVIYPNSLIKLFLSFNLRFFLQNEGRVYKNVIQIYYSNFTVDNLAVRYLLRGGIQPFFVSLADQFGKASGRCECWRSLGSSDWSFQERCNQLESAVFVCLPVVHVNITSLVEDGCSAHNVGDVVRVTIRAGPPVLKVSEADFVDHSRNADRAAAVRSAVRELCHAWSLVLASESPEIVATSLRIIYLNRFDKFCSAENGKYLHMQIVSCLELIDGFYDVRFSSLSQIMRIFRAKNDLQVVSFSL